METDAPKKSTFTFELTNDQQELLLGLMVNGNFRKREVPYSLYSIEGEKFNATLYEKEKHGKRKLCVQGSGAQDFIEFQLEPKGIVPVELGYEGVLHPELFSAHAGSDEAGKGDYFGPLVVCCAYTDEKLSEEMQKLGVKDCKQMTDKAVLAAGAALRKLLGPTGYAVVKLGPAAYNRLYAKIKNINRMLAWAHGTAIEELLEKRSGCDRVVVDQFAPTETTILRALKERGKKAKVEQRHKAESDIAVAAASVIARELFIRSIMEMEQSCAPRIAPPSELASLGGYSLTSGKDSASPLTGAKKGEAESLPLQKEGEKFHIPLGSSDPRVRELAERMVRENGPTWLMNHCKAHFQTTDKVLAACGKSRADLPPEGQVVSSAKRQSPDDISSNTKSTHNH